MINQNAKLKQLFGPKCTGININGESLTGISHINLGLTESMEHDLQPDLYIIYVQPFRITDLMHNLAQLEIRASIPSYSFLSVCGNVFANCYLNQVVM